MSEVHQKKRVYQGYKTKKHWIYSRPKHRNWVEAKIAYYYIQATTSAPKLPVWGRYRGQTMVKYLTNAHFRHLTNQSLTATYQPRKWRESPRKTQIWRVISSRFGSQPWLCVDSAAVILISSEPRLASSIPLSHKLLCFRPLSLLTSDQYIEMIYSSILIDDRGGKGGSNFEAGWGDLITNIHCK